MSKLKDLYLASSIEGLSKMVEVPEAFKKKNIGLYVFREMPFTCCKVCFLAMALTIRSAHS